MHLVVVPLYSAVLALLFLALSIRVIVARRAANIGFGAGGSDDLERRIRSQANFAEYVPLALLLLAMAELNGAPWLWLHSLCILLVVGRLIHAVGLARSSTDEVARIGGMIGSQTAILGAAAALVWLYLR